MDPVSAALSQYLRRIFVATLSQVVDDLFTYLKNEDDEDIKRNPDALKGLPTKGRKKSETVMRKIPQAPVYTEDTSEFSFVKFSKT